ncbi:hypothetical protein Ancab_033469, partial [Ancistrocladus abbreviatus]
MLWVFLRLCFSAVRVWRGYEDLFVHLGSFSNPIAVEELSLVWSLRGLRCNFWLILVGGSGCTLGF